MMYILVRDSKYCIVGEAWGYNGRHAGYYIAPLIALIGCWTCVKFGREMGKIAKLHGQSCINELQPVINHFLEHWNNRHRNITKIPQLDSRFRYVVEVRGRSWFQDLAYNFFADNNMCMGKNSCWVKSIFTPI